MNRLVKVLTTPGTKTSVVAGAPTLKLPASNEADINVAAMDCLDDVGKIIAAVENENDIRFHTEEKRRKLDRWLDLVVQVSGSQ